MILVCSEIKEIKVEGSKNYVYRLVLDTTKPENGNYKAAVFEFASPIRFKDMEAGDLYNIRKSPFGLVEKVNGKIKIKNRIKEAEVVEEPEKG